MENVVISPWTIWLIAAAILLIIELLSNIVATLCLAIGALAGMLMALCGFGFAFQAIMAILVTVVAFATIPKVIATRRNRSKERNNTGSNMDALIGREARVHVDIPVYPGLGRVKIDGDNWQACSPTGTPIAAGTPVKVVGYNSIVLEVEPVENPKPEAPTDGEFK